MRLISFLFLLLLTSPATAHYKKCTGEDRCHDYQKCNWDGQLTWCNKASSSAISFGLKFAGGYDVFIEWAYEDEQGEWIELYDNGYALVDGIKTKFWNTDPNCVAARED